MSPGLGNYGRVTSESDFLHLDVLFARFLGAVAAIVLGQVGTAEGHLGGVTDLENLRQFVGSVRVHCVLLSGGFAAFPAAGLNSSCLLPEREASSRASGART